MSIITELAQQAKKAARTLAILSESQKNAVLTDMAAAIRANKSKIIEVNEKEVARAKENNLDAAMVDRLILNDERIEAMAEGIEVIVELDDPVGKERVIGTRPNGIEIKKMNYVTDNAKVPVIQHFKGVCHLYVDKDADLDKAMALLLNGKTQRTGVCNALEGLVVHQAVAGDFLPKVADAFKEKGVKVHVNDKGSQYFDGADVISEDAYGEEYLGLEIAIRVVDDFEAAVDHIAQFGSNHTEVICTEDAEKGKLFQRAVDASVVMVNASSRFSDGSQLGLGAEIGIATTKLHAYGPMGLESLTSEKYLVNGEGQIRD